mmetsp:Transcript_37236/g.61683  ORF Transcript_37236/g.61683 Transcript_37236/m.61683 type:complete len:271 (-) Transcript_37236:405-1217(-)
MQESERWQWLEPMQNSLTQATSAQCDNQKTTGQELANTTLGFINCGKPLNGSLADFLSPTCRRGWECDQGAATNKNGNLLTPEKKSRQQIKRKNKSKFAGHNAQERRARHVVSIRNSLLWQELDQSSLAESHAQAITTATEPFRVIYVSSAWQKLCGLQSAEVVGLTLDLLSGTGTSAATLAELRKALHKQKPFTCQIIHYTKCRRGFMHTLHVEPLHNVQGEVQFFQHVFSDIEWLSDEQSSSLSLPVKSADNWLKSLELSDVLNLFKS